VREISFDESDLEIGGFRALDYFGDGSFYLLDAPGVSPAPGYHANPDNTGRMQ
jgi:hypothetical protein